MSTTELLLVLGLAGSTIAFAAYCFVLKKNLGATETRARSLNERYTQDVERWNQYSTAMKAELDRLGRWKHVADADAKAAEIINNARNIYEQQKIAADNLLQEAQKRATRVREEAETQLRQAKSEASQSVREAKRKADERLATAQAEADTLLKEARSKARELRAGAQEKFDSATRQAAEIIHNAHERGKTIAGDAYDVVKYRRRWEEAALAIRNTIVGYGREYLLPETGILDDLAEEYSHARAGRDLKSARDRSRSMVKSNTAATCDFTDPQRRESAVRFVLDAFNGKVDGIVSQVKSDNFGKLRQEMKDAFTLVNFHGLAFESARITDEYLEARLSELKLASKVQLLKQKERDEQRLIREQMREEEKARREYERAVKEAEKEEDRLRKAMRETQRQVEAATQEQKAVFEAQLQDLMLKLQTAEEKSQRAISMAQQTKKGHVYIISNIGSFGEHVYKIGLTRRLEPLDRIRELGDASVPFEFDIHALIMSDDAPALERDLHKEFVMAQINKVNHRKEFFRLNLEEIKQQIEKQGYDIKWTMAAQARQYHESIAIEKAIRDDPSLKDSWLSRQLQLDPVGFSDEEQEGDPALETQSSTPVTTEA